MKKLINRFQKHSIVIRLCILILPMLLIAFFVFSNYAGNQYYDTVLKDISDQMRLQVESKANNLNSSLTDIMGINSSIYTNASLRNGLYSAVHYPDQFTIDVRNELYKKVMQPLMSGAASNFENRYSNYLYVFSDRVFCDYDWIFPLDNCPTYIPKDLLQSEGYGKTYFIASEKNASHVRQNTLSIARVIYYTNKTPLAILVTEVNADWLMRELNSILSEKYPTSFAILLNNSQVLAETEKEHEEVISFSAALNAISATIRVEVSADKLHHEAMSQKIRIMMAALVVVLLSGIGIYLVTRVTLHRMVTVTQKYATIAEGKESLGQPLEGTDEAAVLDQTLTALTLKIGEMSEHVYDIQRQKAKLESNLLLAKINPHFLYNTLSAIRWDVPESDALVIDNMVAFYRGVLSRGADAEMLTNELDTIAHYVNLFNFTYTRKAILEIEVPESLKILYVPKFLLQPVVENALIHGGTHEISHIMIKCEGKGENLLIRVINDGIPIALEKMSSINALNEIPADALLSQSPDGLSQHGFGMYYVIARIRLNCGEGYSMTYTVNVDGMTEADILLPVWHSKVECNNYKL